MQFTFTGTKADKKVIDDNKPKELSRSKFMQILVLEAICARLKEAQKKRLKNLTIT